MLMHVDFLKIILTLTGNKSNDCEENNFAIQRKKYRNNFDKSYLSIHSL